MLTSARQGHGDKDISMSIATQSPAAHESVADNEQKRLALGFLQDAWVEAHHEGIDGDCLAQTALFLALAELISTYGEEATARYTEKLAPRVRNGEFSVELARQ
jgi:hypothetical protein